MSSGTRKKKAAAKTPIDRLYDEVCARHSYKFDTKLKSEAWIPLLKKLREGNVSASFAKDVLDIDGVPAYALLPDIFPLLEVPRKLYTITGIIENPGKHFTRKRVAFMPAAGDIHRLYVLSVEEEDIITVVRQSQAFITIQKEEELPYDMRKWSKSLASLYFRCLYANNRSNGKIENIWRRKEILHEDTRQQEILVHIRKINQNPSRRQRKRIEVEKIEHLKKQQALASEMGQDGNYPWLNTAAAPVPSFPNFPPEPVDPHLGYFHPDEFVQAVQEVMVSDGIQEEEFEEEDIDP